MKITRNTVAGLSWFHKLRNLVHQSFSTTRRSSWTVLPHTLNQRLYLTCWKNRMSEKQDSWCELKYIQRSNFLPILSFNNNVCKSIAYCQTIKNTWADSYWFYKDLCCQWLFCIYLNIFNICPSSFNGLSLYQISDAQHYWFTRYHHQNNKYRMVSKPYCYCAYYTNITLIKSNIFPKFIVTDHFRTLN